ncbi:MAG: glycosyltransferase [Candidatus Schekmanbacteria bacterium]|nr:glycosyltransferase [Candidatus Schekmanbacteria bacterium]
MKISIIIPAYNAEKTIGECLKALLDQTYGRESYEVIVVDDGSTDKTAGIAESLGAKVIRQKNAGPAAARNRGVDEAKGDIILFTDSDCVPAKDWIAQMTAPFEDSETGAVKGAYRTEQRSLVARFAQVEFEERFEMLKKADSIDMVDTYSAGYRKEIFLKAGGFDRSFPVANNEDTELSYKLSGLGVKMVFNPDAIVCHLNHPDTVLRYTRLKFWRGYWRMVVYRRFPDKMMKDTYTPQSLKLQILFLFLVAAGAFISLFYPLAGAYFVIIPAIGFFTISLPFIIFAFKKDLPVAMTAPFMLMLRALSIGCGVIWGLVF